MRCSELTNLREMLASFMFSCQFTHEKRNTVRPYRTLYIFQSGEGKLKF